VSTTVSLLSRKQIQRLPERARGVIEYRKSSLNHIQGCPLNCAYCIRHTYGLWNQRRPQALMSDAEAVEALVSHRYFQQHVTPVQVLNRATDPFSQPYGRILSRFSMTWTREGYAIMCWSSPAAA
jgi:DNA repair photolyase